MFKIFMMMVIIIVSFGSGMVAQIYYQDIKEKTQSYESIMLTIPKTDKELEKTYLCVKAHLTLLEEQIKWETTKKTISKGEKK